VRGLEELGGALLVAAHGADSVVARSWSPHAGRNESTVDAASRLTLAGSGHEALRAPELAAVVALADRTGGEVLGARTEEGGPSGPVGPEPVAIQVAVPIAVGRARAISVVVRVTVPVPCAPLVRLHAIASRGTRVRGATRGGSPRATLSHVQCRQGGTSP
jgi:hypothetical protein